MANDSGRASGIRDWLADSRRRIQRYVPRTIASLRPARLASSRTLGVLMQQRGTRTMAQVSRLGLAGTQQPPLVLRRPVSLAAVDEPILTVQASPPPSQIQAALATETTEEPEITQVPVPAIAPGRDEAAAPGLISRSLRRIFNRDEAPPTAAGRTPVTAPTATQSIDLSEGKLEALPADQAASDWGQENEEESIYPELEWEEESEPAAEKPSDGAPVAREASPSSFTLVRQMRQPPEAADADEAAAEAGQPAPAPVHRQASERENPPALPPGRAEPSRQTATAPQSPGLILALRRFFRHEEPVTPETSDGNITTPREGSPEPEPALAHPADAPVNRRVSLEPVSEPRASLAPERATLGPPVAEPASPSVAVTQPSAPESHGPLTFLRRLVAHPPTEVEPKPVVGGNEVPPAREPMPGKVAPAPSTDLLVPRASQARSTNLPERTIQAEEPASPAPSGSQLVFRSAHVAPMPSELPVAALPPPGPGQPPARLNPAPWTPVYRAAAVPQPAAGEETPVSAPAYVHDGFASSSANGYHPSAATASPVMPATSRSSSAPVPAVARQRAAEPAAPSPAPAAPRAESAAAESGLSSAALERLAFQVYERLRRRLITERERAGLGADWQ
jgi:hypothetical protein